MLFKLVAITFIMAFDITIAAVMESFFGVLGRVLLPTRLAAVRLVSSAVPALLRLKC
jgi:hypothetical protein